MSTSSGLRIAFAGTPDFAVPSLQALLDQGEEIVGVLTQPDRPQGRGRKLSASPVKILATEHALALDQPVSLRDISAQQALREWAPDLLIVVAYGLLLPQSVLDIPRLGCINVHGSILPRWRGAAPVARALEAGDAETGVTLMQMDAGLDTGAMLATRRCVIDTQTDAAQLSEALAIMGAQLLAESLPQLASLPPQAQDPALACYAHKLHKSEAPIDWNASAASIHNKIRALTPWPVAETTLQGKRLRVWSATLPGGAAAAHCSAGSVLAHSSAGVDVCCGDGAVLRLLEVQQEGRKRLPAAVLQEAWSQAVLGL